MTRALLCPGTNSPALFLTLTVLVAVPVAGAVVGKLLGELINALRRTRLR